MTWDVAECEAAPLPESGAAPKQVHLFPLGQIVGRDGRKWVLDDVKRVMAAFKARKIDLPIDYEHQCDRAEQVQGPLPVAGLITGREVKEDGLWGEVSRTDRAAQMISAREYRYLSPTFFFEKASGRVTMLKGAALVHSPILHIKALAKEEPQPMSNTDFSDFALALDLPETASKDDILAAMKEAPDPEKYVPVAALRDVMEHRRDDMAQAHEQNVKAKVETAVLEGFITPAMQDWATALCRQNPQSFDDFLASTGPTFAHFFERDTRFDTPPESRTLTSTDEQALCAQLGITTDQLAKS